MLSGEYHSVQRRSRRFTVPSCFTKRSLENRALFSKTCGRNQKQPENKPYGSDCPEENKRAFFHALLTGPGEPFLGHSGLRGHRFEETLGFLPGGAKGDPRHLHAHQVHRNLQHR
jgi:hypothetical protein